MLQFAARLLVVRARSHLCSLLNFAPLLLLLSADGFRPTATGRCDGPLGNSAELGAEQRRQEDRSDSTGRHHGHRLDLRQLSADPGIGQHVVGLRSRWKLELRLESACVPTWRPVFARGFVMNV